MLSYRHLTISDSGMIGVDDGTRTHDDRDHNPGLYQLSYAHHWFFCLYVNSAFVA